ncbi:MAG: fructosamine kinase family protein [Actinomycetota bacterium]|nr:fructosamine kinase family protein [Actinomycetota bacterium]
MTAWPQELRDALGPGRMGAPLGAGVHRATVAGEQIVVKTTAAAPDEADGLERLRRVASGPRVPSVLYRSATLLALEWIPAGARSPAGEEELGRALAGLHGEGEPEWGGGSSWIGDCRVDPSGWAVAADFYGARLTSLAGRCGLDGPVARVVDRLGELIPPGRPVLVHGDLWWGNVLWAADGHPAVIDPSVHGGHPEEDLAMLALFGAVPDRLLGTYAERRPLAEGWLSRVALWQLYPLLVHSVVFGDSYRASARAVAERYG